MSWEREEEKIENIKDQEMRRMKQEGLFWVKNSRVREKAFWRILVRVREREKESEWERTRSHEEKVKRDENTFSFISGHRITKHFNGQFPFSLSFFVNFWSSFSLPPFLSLPLSFSDFYYSFILLSEQEINWRDEFHDITFYWRKSKKSCF